ncbi:hypothetical protein [Methylobacterium sp. SyP6R]|uniref:hypothetical protein n=1 Tax=Methylobacterium sp. SyP6R TaxID=2718876 RepID=UPI001F30FFA0|nr:hypothetical protein [Methylobacterium sp. SyP6R]MCF4125049.1 hypothetical protein [Methylobacterium sp. SyP6R]
MPTLMEMFTQATSDLRAAVASVVGLEARVQAKFDANTNNVTTIINNFNARPLAVTFYVDPINGNNANDGASLAAPKRSTDNVLASLGSQGVSIVLLGDDVIRLRHNAATNVYIYGAQRAANAQGWVNYLRTVTLLGIAENSPSLTVGTMSAGIFFSAGQFFSANCNFVLPDVPAGYSNRAHFCSAAFVNMQFTAGTLTASGPGAAALVGSFNGGRSVVTLTGFTLGTNASGHVFDGIAAGADPNGSWNYSTNLKAA